MLTKLRFDFKMAALLNLIHLEKAERQVKSLHNQINIQLTVRYAGFSLTGSHVHETCGLDGH